MNATAVLAEGLCKRYADVDALDRFDLELRTGTVCGLLGPNGAGKTTAVRILTTLVRFDGGRAEVAGFDVARDPAQVRYRIGLVGQNAAVDEILAGRRNLELFGRLYHLTPARAAARAVELLDRFGLADAADKPVKDYSGGMRRRLDLAVSLILAPTVLFLDEPTAGLDPRGRSEVWASIRDLVAAGTTVLLTTQYLDEADQLADRISMIDGGRVIAEGSPDELKSQLGGDRIDVVLRDPDQIPSTAELVERATGAAASIDTDGRRVSCAVGDRMAALSAVVSGLEDHEIDAEDVELRRPTLDEVFMHLTERSRHDAQDADAQPLREGAA